MTAVKGHRRIDRLEDAARDLAALQDAPELVSYRVAAVGAGTPFLPSGPCLQAAVAVLHQAAACLQHRDATQRKAGSTLPGTPA